MRRTIRALLASVLALLVCLGLAWPALWMDRRLGLVWRLPSWTEPVAMGLLLLGVTLVMSFFHAQTRRTEVASTHPPPGGELRRVQPSQMRLAFGLWLCGSGLACLLRSPSLLAVAGLVMASLSGGRIDERGRLARLLEACACFANRTPRWIAPALLISTSAAGLAAVSIEPAVNAATTEPAIFVQIRCKPGTAPLWRASFEEHVRPAIDEVIARGDSFTGFQLIEPALPAQGFDFILLYAGRSFAGLDQPRPFPHYVAVFEREGPIRALIALKQMGSYEDQVTVTLVHRTTTK